MFNAEKYIGECLDSIIGQTYSNLEIIIVDDDSTDDSAAIVSKYENVKFIKQEHLGISVARNAGLDSATGDLIHFVDADDKLADADFYEKVIAGIGDADIAVVGMIDEKRPARPTVEYNKLKFYKDKQAKINASLVARRPAVWRFIYRHEFLRDTGLRFEPGRITCQDVMFTVPAVFYARSMVAIPGVYYWYRRAFDGAMRDPARARARVENKKIVWGRAARFAVDNRFFLGFRRSFWKWMKLKFFK